MTDLTLTDLNQPVDFAKQEEKVLDYWDAVDAFNRSVNERPKSKPYVFYDGPPFATGLPHYGHLLGSIMKDIIPRYFTMRGFRVERVWGWDCHGLPIENIIEAELKLEGGKKGIESYGIAKFNQACRQAILRFDQDWEKVIRRIGRWVDMKHSYKTMDFNYMESVWWAFKSLYEKGLVYEGKKVILYCPRCATPLSNFEIAMDNSYQDISEASTVYKFPVSNTPHTYLLAWSTTPWNKLATPALAVNPKLSYVKVRQGEDSYILAETTLGIINGEYEIIDKFNGQDLEKLTFDLLYDYYPDRQGLRAGVVVADDYVTAEEGTGIVTLAVYGEEDYRVMQKHQIQLVEHVDDQGRLKPEVVPWAGMDILAANSLIDLDLEKRGLIYKHLPHTHSVPVCYRCGTRLYYAPLPAWFVNIQQLKPRLKALNETINWYPSHLKYGRFGKGLDTAPDWNISRSRYWGTPMPIWINLQSGHKRIVGSLSELKQWAVDQSKVEGINDLHRENLDDIELYVDDAKTEIGVRVKEVFDCWVESGSMSFASVHYPFENKAKFEARFPAQYIVEYIAQTRAWFYTLHVMATAIFDKPAFQNALTTGTIMAEDGSKMSKSKRNFPDPLKIIDTYGVDSLRLYFASSPVMKTAQNVNFSPEAINEIRKKVFNIMWNVFKFYRLFDDGWAVYGFPPNPQDVIDQWLISLTQSLTQKVAVSLDHYDVVTASRALMDYVQDLSTWYIRRSRDRLREGNTESIQILRTALKQWSLVMAPFAPFFTEMIYQNLPGEKLDSIHLELFPKIDVGQINSKLETEMTEIRQIVERAHAQRKVQQLKVRQPLAKITLTTKTAFTESLNSLIAAELNVKAVEWQAGDELQVELDTHLTPELIAEGEAREIIRKIMDERKKLKTGVTEPVTVTLPSWPEAYTDMIKQKVFAKNLLVGDTFSVVRLSD